MALNQATLKGMIVDNLETEFGAADDSAMLNKFANAVAKAVVDHVTDSAEVEVTDVVSGGDSASGTVS